jgi:hypothetical protein
MAFTPDASAAHAYRNEKAFENAGVSPGGLSLALDNVFIVP